MCLLRYPKLQEKRYYMETENFITEKVIVDNIIHNEQQGYIVFWLSEIDDSYQCPDFIIEGKNYSIVWENGIQRKLSIGDEITITSAPKYFGNGDFMPIVSITIGDECLLSFDVGHKNLIEMY